ncbi:MAG: hypothetical protein PF549_01555, partial [Patescibacteria group bacterium]|nr:hypothetical protein [Patescibacteria group bacterium]
MAIFKKQFNPTTSHKDSFSLFLLYYYIKTPKKPPSQVPNLFKKPLGAGFFYFLPFGRDSHLSVKDVK